MNPLRITVAVLLTALAALAADQPAPPPQFTHRITGLFSPDREVDLHVALEKIPNVKLVRVDFDHAEAALRKRNMTVKKP